MAANSPEARISFPTPAVFIRNLNASRAVAKLPKPLTSEQIRELNREFVIVAAASEFSSPETIVYIQEYEKKHPNERLTLENIFNPNTKVDGHKPAVALPVIDGSGKLVFRAPKRRLS